MRSGSVLRIPRAGTLSHPTKKKGLRCKEKDGREGRNKKGGKPKN